MLNVMWLMKSDKHCHVKYDMGNRECETL